MSLNNKLERIKRIHDLIRFKRTGKPEQFARKIGLSRRALFNELKELKALGAPISYCNYRESYQYIHPVEFRIGFIPPSVAQQELRAINGGTILRPLNITFVRAA